MTDETSIDRSGTVSDISDEELLRRAVVCARAPNACVSHPRWFGVSRVFVLGSTYSQQLCRRFGLDPEEYVR